MRYVVRDWKDNKRIGNPVSSLDDAREIGVNHFKGTRSVKSLEILNENFVIIGHVQRGRLGNEWVTVWSSAKDKRFRILNSNGTIGDHLTSAEARQLLTESNVAVAKRISTKRDIPEYVAYGKLVSRQRGKFEKIYKEKY